MGTPVMLRRVQALNERIAVSTVGNLSTMWAAYLFLFWSLLPLLDLTWQTFVFYISGGILQLVLLPLIMVGQSVVGRNAEKRAQQDHETIMAEFAELKEIHRILLERLPNAEPK